MCKIVLEGQFCVHLVNQVGQKDIIEAPCRVVLLRYQGIQGCEDRIVVCPCIR